MSGVVGTSSGVRIAAAHLSPIQAVAGTAAGGGGGLVVTAGGDDMIRSWRAATGQAADFVVASPGLVTFLAVVPAGAGGVVVCAIPQGVYRWDLVSGEPIGTPIQRPELAWARTSGLNCVAVLENGDRPVLVSGGTDGLVRRWDLVGGVEVGPPLAGHEGEVTAVAVLRLADGRRVIVSAGRDLTVRRWDAQTGAPLGEPMGRRRSPVLALACTAGGVGGDVVVTQTAGGTVRRWDVATGEPIGPALGSGGEGRVAVGLAVTPDGGALLSVGRSGLLGWWDLTGLEPVTRALSGPAEQVNVVSVVPDAEGGPLLVSGGENGLLRRWDRHGHEVGDAVRAHPSRVADLIGVPAGDAPGGRALLLSAGRDGARCWDAATGDPVGTPPYTMKVLYGLAPCWLSDGRLVLATGVHEGVWRHDVLGGQDLGFSAHLEDIEVWGVAAGTLPDGAAFIAAAATDGLVYRVDPATGEPLGPPLHGFEDQVFAVAVTTLPDGRVMIAAGGAEQTILRWDAVSGTPIGQPLVGHDAWIGRLAFLPLPSAGPMLVSVDDIGQVRRWDAITGATIGEPFLSGGEEISNVRLAAIGTTRPPQFVTSGDDEIARRWDALTGQLLDERPGASSAAFATTPDGRAVLAVGTTDGTIVIESLRTEAPEP